MEQKFFFNVQSGKGDMLKKTYVFLKGDLYQRNCSVEAEYSKYCNCNHDYAEEHAVWFSLRVESSLSSRLYFHCNHLYDITF